MAYTDQGNDILYFNILHYHLLQGGVYTVITNTLRSLIAYSPYRTLNIRLITSDAKGSAGQKLITQLKQWHNHCQRNTSLNITPVEIPQLSYNQSPANSRDELFSQADNIANNILKSLNLQQCPQDRPAILNTHNINLGKNPRLTLAIKLLAEKALQQKLPLRIMMQVHDFAEDGRAACWNALRDCSGKSNTELAVQITYPVNPYIHWVCINSTDRDTLIKMHIPAEQISVIPNAVYVSADDQNNNYNTENGVFSAENDDLWFADDLKQRIARWATRQGRSYDVQNKIVLYPVKAIRRKNVIEAILLMLMHIQHSNDKKWQLIISLPPVSDEDMRVFNTLNRFIDTNNLPVLTGLGSELFPGGHHRIVTNGKIEYYSIFDLIKISHSVVTTSVQEGFGYVFHEPWLMGKAVFGRNIRHVTYDFKNSGMKLEHLYDKLLIPLGWLGKRWEKISEKYCQKVAGFCQNMGIFVPKPAEIVQKVAEKKLSILPNRYILTKKVPNLTGQKPVRYVDFADLDFENQLYVMQKCVNNPALFADIIGVNGQLAPISCWLCGGNSDIIVHNGQVVAKCYSLKAKADKLVSLISRLNAPVGDFELTKGVTVDNGPLWQRCVELDSMRLLA